MGSIESESVMRKLYKWNTSIGPFFIAEHERRFHVLYENESLGSYATSVQAADDVAGGHTFSAGPGIDTAALGISDQLSHWERVE